MSIVWAVYFGTASGGLVTMAIYAPKQCVEIVKAWEGFAALPYLCPAGYWTVGYGHVCRDNQGRMLKSNDAPPEMKELTIEDASELLRNDLESYVSEVVALCGGGLNMNQLSALGSFAYNVGTGALRASTLRRKVLAGEHGEAAEQFKRWVFAGGMKLKGLVRRRRDESALYLRPCDDFMTLIVEE